MQLPKQAHKTEARYIAFSLLITLKTFMFTQPSPVNHVNLWSCVCIACVFLCFFQPVSFFIIHFFLTYDVVITTNCVAPLKIKFKGEILIRAVSEVSRTLFLDLIEVVSLLLKLLSITTCFFADKSRGQHLT